MPRFVLGLAFLATFVCLTAGNALAKEKAKDREARAQGEVRQVVEKYLAARFRGAPWKDYRDFVTWTEEQEAAEPACTTAIRSYSVSNVRLKDKETALATVVFYQLGPYCPATGEFRPAPRLDNAIIQLRKRSIIWSVEKTSRPGGQLDWNVVRDRLQQQLADPVLSRDSRAQIAQSLLLLERTANAIGRTGPEMRKPEETLPQ